MKKALFKTMALVVVFVLAISLTGFTALAEDTNTADGSTIIENQEPAPSESPAPEESPAPSESPAPEESPAPSESPAPTDEVPGGDLLMGSMELGLMTYGGDWNTIDYHSNGGNNSPSDSNYADGALATIKGPESMYRTGYAFVTWNTKENGSGTNYSPGYSFQIYNDLDLYAQWTPAYSVTYNNNGGSGSQTDPNSPYIPASTVTVLDKGTMSRSGKVFTGWNTKSNGTGTGYQPGATFNITSNRTLYAQWADAVTVTYNANGGTGSQSDNANPHAKGSSVTVMGQGTINKNGNAFKNWNTQSDGSGTSYNPGDTFTIMGDTTLYAQFVCDDNTLDLYVYYGGPAPQNPPLLVHFTFTGLTAANITTLQSNSNWSAFLTNLDGMVAENISPYALLDASQYYGNGNIGLEPGATDCSYIVKIYLKDAGVFNVTYNANGGINAPTDPNSPYVSGGTVTVLGPGSMTYAGHTFTGWNTAANGSGTAYDPGDTFTISADTTLYAQWEEDVTYTVTYDANGGTGSQTDPNSPYASGATVTVLGQGTMANIGYDFAGWDTAADGSGTPYGEGATFNIAGNTTLYAQWTIKTYTVTYDANGGTGSQSDPSSPYDSGSLVTVLGQGTMDKDEYDFAGWNTAADGSGTSYAESATFNIAENTTLYAQWEIQTFTIDTSVSHGTITPDATVDYGTNKTINYSPNTGYHLVSVIVDAGTAGEMDVTATNPASYTFTNVMANHTIAVVYAINTYTIDTTAIGSGTIDPDQIVNYNANKTIHFSPNTGYHVSSINVDGTTLGPVATAIYAAAGQYTFTHVKADHTITVTFAINQYFIVSAAVNGTIDPGFPGTLVDYGSDQTFNYSPDPGYHLAYLWVDGNLKDINTYPDSYTFANVTHAHIILAVFEINTYDITTSVTNGTIDPSTTVEHGDDVTINYSPDAGYHLDSLLIDGSPVDITLYPASYTFNDVDDDHTIEANFVSNTYTIDTSATGSGTIDPDVTVDYGNDVTINYAPSTGYHVFSVTVDGSPVDVGTYPGSYTFSAVDADHTISVVFAIISYRVEFLDFDGTSLNVQWVHYGAGATAPGAPARPGFTFAGWDKAFNHITGSLTVTALYTPIPIVPAGPVAPAPAPTVIPEASAPAAAPSVEPEATPAPEVIIEEQLPEAAPGIAWALLNLLLAIATAVMAIVLVVGYFTRRKNDDRYNVKKRGVARLLSLIPGIGGIIVFLLTEPWWVPHIVFTDVWTWLMIVIFAAQIVVAIFAHKKREEKDDGSAPAQA